MEKLDLKDRKILYELDLNSRQSFRSIGRKVGLSKDIVASRVKKLQEEGIIIRFNTLIDKNNKEWSAEVELAKGEPENPASWEEIHEKFYFFLAKNIR